MYKFAILFLLLITYNSQSLTSTYKLTFENQEAAYTLQVKEGKLVFENNQPNVTITTHEAANSAATTNQMTHEFGKFYKITKGTTWQHGLKIGGMDNIEIVRIGGMDDIEIVRIGGSDDIDIVRIAGTDDIIIINTGDMNPDDIAKIGEMDDIEIVRIAGSDDIIIINTGDMNPDDIAKIGDMDDIDLIRAANSLLLEVKDYHDYDISLGFDFITVVEKSTQAIQKVVIPEKGLYINVLGNTLRLFG